MEFVLFSSGPSAWPSCGTLKVRACSVFSVLSSTLIDHFPTPASPRVSHLICRHCICWWLNLDGSDPLIPKWTYHSLPKPGPSPLCEPGLKGISQPCHFQRTPLLSFKRGKKKSKQANPVSRGRSQIGEKAYRQCVNILLHLFFKFQNKVFKICCFFNHEKLNVAVS